MKQKWSPKNVAAEYRFLLLDGNPGSFQCVICTEMSVFAMQLCLVGSYGQFLTVKNKEQVLFPSDNLLSIRRMFEEFKLLCDEMSADLVPRTSKHKYYREWKRFKSFLKSMTFLPFMSKPLRPTSWKSQKSLPQQPFNDCNTGEPQADVLWQQLKNWIDNLERDYKQQNAMAFDGEELQHWIATSDHSFPPKLQKNLIAIVAYTGGLRVHEDYMLTFEDFTYNNQKHEFVVKVPKIKGNVEGKTFIVQQ